MLMVFPGRKGWEMSFSLPRILGTRFFSSHFLQVQVSSPLINFKAEIYRGEGEPSLCDGPDQIEHKSSVSVWEGQKDPDRDPRPTAAGKDCPWPNLRQASLSLLFHWACP